MDLEAHRPLTAILRSSGANGDVPAEHPLVPGVAIRVEWEWEKSPVLWSFPTVEISMLPMQNRADTVLAEVTEGFLMSGLGGRGLRRALCLLL